MATALSTLERFSLTPESLARFCERWKIARLSLFGSALRPDFHSESDVDLLIAFRPDAEWSLWDWIELKGQLAGMFGRPVDLVEESGLKNPFRRREILATRQVLYADPTE